MKNPKIRYRGLPLLLLIVSASQAVPAQTTFTPADIIRWEPHSFSGETRYQLAERGGEAAVHAVCDSGSASGLFYRGEIDLTETPIVEWEWFVPATYEGLDETTRSGDDYPARVYAVDEHQLAIWRTRAMNYVWANELPAGSEWPNAYQNQAQMLAMRSGPAPSDLSAGQWLTERRNLRQDFMDYHDRELSELDALAIMTDCDDAGQTAEAWYGTIRLLSAGQEN